MSKGRAHGDSSSSSRSSSRSTDHKSLRRCMEWRYNVESTPPDTERETLSMTNTWQENMAAPVQTMHINPKVSRAIESMKTSDEAQDFLDVASSIRAERAAELAVLEQQLEQCRQEIRMLESKMMAARGRVVDADRGIATMRLLMQEKGILLDK